MSFGRSPLVSQQTLPGATSSCLVATLFTRRCPRNSWAYLWQPPGLRERVASLSVSTRRVENGSVSAWQTMYRRMMRVLVGTSIEEIDALPELDGRPLVLDVGTGDGRFAYEQARADGSRFFVGLDPDAA